MGGITAVGDSPGFWQHQVVALAPELRKSHCWFMSYFSTASESPLNVGPEANFHFGVKWQSTHSCSQGPALVSFAKMVLKPSPGVDLGSSNVVLGCNRNHMVCCISHIIKLLADNSDLVGIKTCTQVKISSYVAPSF